MKVLFHQLPSHSVALRLQVTSICSNDDDVYHNVVASAVAAAATVTGLQSLLLQVERGQHVLPDDLLLPLTAAVGGPGSSLTSLKLYGSFVPEVAQRATPVLYVAVLPDFLLA